jgi:hypothetical protein
MVHKDTTNHLGAQGKEVHTTLARNALSANELEVSLVGQCGRFETVRLAPVQMTAGNSPDLRVNNRYESFERVFIALIPGGE